MSPWIGVIVLLAVIAWNAFFVAAEYSFVAARPSRLEELAAAGSSRAVRVLALREHPTRFISAVQVAITMSSLAAGAIGEPAVRRLVQQVDGPLGDATTTAISTAVSVALAFAVVTALTVVLGEIVPKTLSLVHTERVALATVDPVRLFAAVFRPFIAALDGLARAVNRLIGLPAPETGGGAQSEEELRLILQASREEGVLDAVEEQMLTRIFDFAETPVRRVMVPRPDVTTLSAGMTVDQALDAALASPHSRFPVTGEGSDDLRGLVTVRELARLTRAGRGRDRLGEVSGEALIVPESRGLEELLGDLRRERTHFAIVVDEYGGFAGVTTLTDVTEEIVGEVGDGVEARPAVQELGPGLVRVPGAYPIEDFNDRFGTTLEADEVSSLGGLVFKALGRVPSPGDSVEVDGVSLRVRRLDGPRIVELDAALDPGA